MTSIEFAPRFDPYLIVGEDKLTESVQKEDSIEEEKDLKEKKYLDLRKITVIVTSLASIKPIFKAIAHLLAHAFSFGQTSKMFKAKFSHDIYDLGGIWAKYYFGEDAVGESRNIGRKDVLENKKDYEAANLLLDECQKLYKNGKLRDIKIDPNKQPETMISDGICAGIRLDIAERLLIRGEKLIDSDPTIEETIIRKNQEGAPAEASANQAIYALLDPYESVSKSMQNIFTYLGEISTTKTENQLFAIDFNVVGSALAQVDPELRSNPLFIDFLAGYPAGQVPSEDPRANELPYLIRNLVEEQAHIARKLEQDKLPNTGWLRRKGRGNSYWEIADPLTFQQAVIKKINAKYAMVSQSENAIELTSLKNQQEKEINTLEWVIAFLEHMKGIEIENEKQNEEDGKLKNAKSTTFQEDMRELWKALIEKALAIFGVKPHKPNAMYDKISNPLLRHTIISLYEVYVDNKRYQAVAQARGLKLEGLSKVMGHHSMYNSDEAYLKNLPKLTNGVYSVNFGVGDGGHAITYVKVSDQEGYILDPNGYVIKCRNPQHTIKQFLKLLAIYEEPHKKSPANLKDKLNHQLNFQKFEVLSVS